MKVIQMHVEHLKLWEENPRRNDHAVDAVAKSIKAFGFNVPILCDNEFRIVAGHTRWKAAKSIGMTSVPVIILDLTENQQKAFAIADNKTAEIADWDWPQLREIVEELERTDLDLDSLGFSSNELCQLLNDGLVDDAIPDMEEKSSIERGDLFQLGQHRLICGDSSDFETCQRVLANEQIGLAISSPPRFNNLGLGTWASVENYLEDIKITINNIATHLNAGGVIFWNIGNPSNLKTNLVAKHAGFFEEANLQYREMLFLSRPYAAFGTKRSSHIWLHGHYYPAHQCNPVWVYQKEGKMPKMTNEGRKYMSDFTTDLWEINYVANQVEKLGHPGVTPVELPFRAIQAYSSDNEIIFDPFGGVGTTLIAAEKAGAKRAAFLIEINPVYCETSIRRWENYTGEKARKIDKNEIPEPITK